MEILNKVIDNIIVNNIVRHIIDVYHNPFSLFVNCIIIVLILLFVLAIYIKSVRLSLIKINLLDNKENPKGFLFLILSIYLTLKIIQIFIFQIFLVDGPSMLPTLKTGNILIADRLSMINKNEVDTLERGSVAVFNLKKEGDFANGRYLVKRIIGIPGDTVIIDNNQVKIITSGGSEIIPDESFINRQKIYSNLYLRLAKDEYFFMGDNRDESYDSRYFGPIKYQDISGEALFMLYPRFEYYPGKSLNYK